MSEGPEPLDLAVLERKVAADPGAPEFPLLAEAYRRSGRVHDARRIAVAGLAAEPDDGTGRLALGIALLDLGETAAAQYELERAISVATGGGLDAWFPARDGGETFGAGIASFDESVPRMPPEPRPYGAHLAAPLRDAGLGEDELERAFASAESLPDEMVDANRIAEAALRATEPSEDVDLEPLVEVDAFPLDGTGPFATETMAQLLESQGDESRADAIRERLDHESVADAHASGMDAAEVPALDAAAPLSAEQQDRVRILTTLERWLENLRGAAA